MMMSQLVDQSQVTERAACWGQFTAFFGILTALVFLSLLKRYEEKKKIVYK